MSDEIIISNNPVSTEPVQPETETTPVTTPPAPETAEKQVAVKSQPAQEPSTPATTDTTNVVDSTENSLPEMPSETPEALKDTPVIESSNKPVVIENTLTSTPEISKTIVLNRSTALKLLIKAREAIQFRRRKKLDRLMTLFLKKPQITNNDVEKLLHVSNTTASRYLSILEKENKIRQNGKNGKEVTFMKI